MLWGREMMGYFTPLEHLSGQAEYYHEEFQSRDGDFYAEI